MSTHKSPALFRRTSFTRLKPTVERAVGIFLLALSWIGTLLFAGGGWETWSVLQPNWPKVVLGLVLQFGCTSIQWVYSDSWFSKAYWAAVSCSTSSSAAGYFPLILLLLPLLELQPEGVAWWVTLFVVVVASLLLDITPERVLFSD